MGKVADLSVFTPGGQPGAPNPSEGLAVLRQNQTAFMETIGVMPPESLTIADGAISPTTAVCIVDTEGGAPADNLTTINATLSDGGTLHDGMVILLSAKDASRVVTVKNSDAPNGVKTVDGKDIALSTEWSLVLQYVGGVWQQINVAAPLKPATETTLGGVKVGDGLTMQDGVISADLATAEDAGRVKASETAKAGAVPLGGADGALDKSWRERKPGEYIFSHADEVKGALRCDGSALSRVTYADLFAVIGTTFGEGDGKTTFNLPDARGKVLEGATDSPGKILQPGLPDIEGDAKLYNSAIGVAAQACRGAFKQGEAYYSGVVSATSTEVVAKLELKASLGNTIYGASDTVQMAAITTNIFIVY